MWLSTDALLLFRIPSTHLSSPFAAFFSYVHTWCHGSSIWYSWSAECLCSVGACRSGFHAQSVRRRHEEGKPRYAYTLLNSYERNTERIDILNMFHTIRSFRWVNGTHGSCNEWEEILRGTILLFVTVIYLMTQHWCEAFTYFNHSTGSCVDRARCCLSSSDVTEVTG